MSELLATVYVRIQSQQLLALQRGICEQAVQSVTAGAICGETELGSHLSSSHFTQLCPCLTLAVIVTLASPSARAPPGPAHLLLFLLLLLLLLSASDLLHLNSQKQVY